MELGKYFSTFDASLEFSFQVFSSSIDIARLEEKNDIEIHGKTFAFSVNALRDSGRKGQSIADLLVKEMSDSAPRMFKNLILGVRAHQYHRESSSPKITDYEMLKTKLQDFGLHRQALWYPQKTQS